MLTWKYNIILNMKGITISNIFTIYTL